MDVHPVGRISRKIYQCITDDIITDEVIVTNERINHIKEHHPNDYEYYDEFLREIIENPDYIIETKKMKTALVLKRIGGSEKKFFKMVLRLITSQDNIEFRNSIITFMKINEKEWNRLLRNKTVLYKRE